MAFRFPEGSWDSHIHIIDPDRFELEADRYNTSNCVYVVNRRLNQISEPQTTHPNLPPLKTVRSSKKAAGKYRGVAVVDTENATEKELDDLHEAGVRGLRVNMGSSNNTDKIVAAVKANIAIAKPRGWVVQIWVPLSAMVELHPVIERSGVTFVCDHFVHTEVGSRTNNAANTIDPYKSKGFTEVIDLIQRKLLFVKISAPYQNSKQGPLYEDMRVVAQTLITAEPDMVVYGSDWPHTASKEGNGPSGPLVASDCRDINDDALVEIIKDWAGSEAQIQRLFVDNPRRLWQWYSED
ncbi:amidohydrolase family protein [Hypomontagnella monticulosa]|nr:amidohydrolase family protein [Hypomontagnella monticulosa]